MRLLERGGEGRGVPNCAGSCPRPQILPPSPPPKCFLLLLPPPPNASSSSFPPPNFSLLPKILYPPLPTFCLITCRAPGGVTHTPITPQTQL